MRFLFVVIFTFCLSNIFTQSTKITGKVEGKNKMPLENVWVEISTKPKQQVITDSTGTYSFFAPANDTLKLYFFIDDYREVKSIFTLGSELIIEPVIFPILQQKTVNVIQKRQDPFEITKMPILDNQRLTGSVERTLTLTTAATSNNELTTNYNVRGGNYDENLVYVNGFLVYRPFLTRSGQQEGMSFIHSSLVESLRFSAGGFDAQYGDRLSSVLDITYKTPSKFNASGMASLLGVEGHAEQQIGKRFNYLVGARYRSNGYLLNSLPTKGAYNPVFADAQLLTNFEMTKKLTLSFLGHFSSNNYRFQPQTSNTDFGTANEAYSFRIYFDGQEQTRFQTLMGGLSLKYAASTKTQLDLYATVFNTDEREYFDIDGQYYINQLETDPSKEEYGDSVAVLGIGSFLNHARNRLNATISSVYHNGSHLIKSGFSDNERNHFQFSQIKWGVGFQHDQFYDVLSEWKLLDSAGYSLPQSSASNQIELFEVIKGNLNLRNERFNSFVQWNRSWSKTSRNKVVSIRKKIKSKDEKSYKVFNETLLEATDKWALSLGGRGVYTTFNNEYFITPRAAISYFPKSYFVHNNQIKRRDLTFRLSTGLYYQPPFYREFRTFTGSLNPNVKSQKSLHVVAGTNFLFDMWNRKSPFKFTGEIFYKYLWDVNPYEIDNVRTRYFANNDAVAYAYGFDMNVHGEFVSGIESFFKMGVLSTRENLKNDQYTEYYNASGEKIIFGFSEDQVVVDSSVIFPGYIPRPTDQLFTFGALVQDQMPGLENFTVQMGMQFGSPLPYGPPDHDRYKDTLRMRSYFRVDLGFAYDLINPKKSKDAFWNKNFSNAMISFEIFNLLGVNNVLSKQWIQDVEGKFYAIPNYLTQRRFNLKLILRLK